MNSLRPYLLVLDGLFLASAGCGTSTPPDGGVIIGGGGCVEAGVSISYLTCSSGDAGDAGDASDASVTCYPGCSQACFAQNNGMTCAENGLDGSVSYATCTTIRCGAGRRPHGCRMPRTRGTGVTAWLGDAAWMEAASVHAFVRLARELEAHGAPRWLASEARRAARDEARHARSMRALARARGVAVHKVRFTKTRVRSLEAIARENATEGLVMETYGALAAHVQSRSATDADIRGAMERIAPDEKRHAALSMAVAEWLSMRLSDAQRRRVERVRVATRERLLADLDRSGGLAEAGIPAGADLARALFFAVEGLGAQPSPRPAIGRNTA